jgi:hypothetical protein
MDRIPRRFSMRPAPSLVAAMLATLLITPLAHAQYSWIDDNGTRVFSDRPPPPGTPANRILKAPRPSLPPPDAQAPAPAPSTAPSPNTAPPAPPSLADRDADFRKRQAQRQADDQKAQQDAARRADNQERCQSIRQEQAQLASGARISQVGSTGERGFLTDEDRAKRMARTQQQLAECQAAAQ